MAYIQTPIRGNTVTRGVRRDDGGGRPGLGLPGDDLGHDLPAEPLRPARAPVYGGPGAAGERATEASGGGGGSMDTSDLGTHRCGLKQSAAGHSGHVYRICRVDPPPSRLQHKKTSGETDPSSSCGQGWGEGFSCGFGEQRNRVLPCRGRPEA